MSSGNTLIIIGRLASLLTKYTEPEDGLISAFAILPVNKYKY